MNLSSAIDYLTHDKGYLQRQLSPKYREAIQVLIETIEREVDIDEADWHYDHEKPMCIHCSGNGCASCKGTGDDYYSRKIGNSD